MAVDTQKLGEPAELVLLNAFVTAGCTAAASERPRKRKGGTRGSQHSPSSGVFWEAVLH